MSEARVWDYLYFTNPQDNKTYYYFITKVDYVSDTVVKLFLEMDVLQTYLFNWDLRPCFVERMTAPSDEIGENTVDEGLEVGALMEMNKVDLTELQDLSLLALSSVDLRNIEIDYEKRPYEISFIQDAFSFTVGEVFSGLGVFQCKNTTLIDGFFDALSRKGVIDQIISLWLYPKALIEATETDSEELAGFFETVESDVTKDVTFNAPSNYLADGYMPRNKKLLTYPYRFFHISNNNGGHADYRLERFTDGTLSFELQGSIFPDGGVKIVPKNYNGVGFNHEYSLTLSGFPTCAWNSDTYKIWLAQNQNQHQMNYITGGLSAGAGVGLTIAGAVTANPTLAMSGTSMAYSGAMSIFNQIAQKEDMKSVPDQARGNQNASVNASHGMHTFTGCVKSISPERAKIIDDYFTMYGYKQSRVMKPTICNRNTFTYIKTVDCFVDGEFCNEDKLKIEAIFNKGVTFWANPSQIGNYFADNGVLK